MKSEQPNWLGWYWFEGYVSWQNNSEIWAKINDGSLADLIMKEIDELYENIVKNKIKIEP